MYPTSHARSRGFTLVELLVAVAVMALMGLMSWRGLESMGRAQDGLQTRSDDLMALQSTLSQWGADLDAIETQPGLQSLEWDGRALRILRRSSAQAQAGLLVVAWARRSRDGQSYWSRWQSPHLLSRGDIEQAWQRAALWAQNASQEDRRLEVPTVLINSWQIFFYRGNAWTNPLSSADALKPAVSGVQAVVPSRELGDLPDGVRLELNVSLGQGLSGRLTRDWARPVLGAAS